jgi:hypothetical protein
LIRDFPSFLLAMSPMLPIPSPECFVICSKRS